jgi:hypothetical protein
VSEQPPGGGGGGERPQNVATAITDISERMTSLIHDEIELAKAEVSAKVGRLLRGTIVAGAAGIFIITALLFALQGVAWLLYFELPIGSQFTYFWGFFVLAAILLILGALAGWAAFRAVKVASPPVPTMAIEEARKIRETVSPPAEPAEDGKGTPQ